MSISPVKKVNEYDQRIFSVMNMRVVREDEIRECFSDKTYSRGLNYFEHEHEDIGVNAEAVSKKLQRLHRDLLSCYAESEVVRDAEDKGNRRHSSKRREVGRSAGGASLTSRRLNTYFRKRYSAFCENHSISTVIIYLRNYCFNERFIYDFVTGNVISPQVGMSRR